MINNMSAQGGSACGGKKIGSLAIILFGVLLLSGCSLYGGNSTTSPSVNPAPAQAPVSGNAVNIQGFAFNPSTLTVKKGETVTWTNSDSAPHQIKSAAFNSNLLSKGQSFSFTFDSAGTFDYSCAIHPSMTGKIIVE